MARPYTKLPPGARMHLERMAESGMLSESRAADALGMPLVQFRRVIEEHQESRRIWQDALAIERDCLLDALYQKAVEGDTKAATTLLAVRHGLNEKSAEKPGERVSVVFQLPEAMPAEKYIEAMKPSLRSDG